MSLEISKIDINRNSGHITALVRVIEEDGSTGPPESVGIDHESLTGKYGCPHTASPAEVEAALTRWLANHYVGALSRKRALDSRASVVVGLQGRIMKFAEKP